MGLVELGGHLVQAARLEPAAAGTGDPALLEAVARCEATGGFGEAFQATGWRVLHRDGSTARVGAWSDVWGGWVVLRLEERPSGWEVTGSQYGRAPGPTPQERGRGLSLRWPHEPVLVRRGRAWRLEVELVNGRDEPVDLEIDGPVLGHLTRDGRRLPDEEHIGFAGTAVETRLGPGRAFALPVLLVTRGPTRLPRGVYGLHASCPDLALVAPPGVLRVA